MLLAQREANGRRAVAARLERGADQRVEVHRGARTSAAVRCQPNRRLPCQVREGGRHLFVTTGIGTSIVPIRLGRPPEIAVLTLIGADGATASSGRGAGR
jgi:hypothetical protein